MLKYRLVSIGFLGNQRVVSESGKRHFNGTFEQCEQWCHDHGFFLSGCNNYIKYVK